LGLSTTIIISDEGIKYESVFKEVSIEWDQIKSYGVFVDNRYNRYQLKKEKYDKFLIAAEKFIFITDVENYKPSKFKSRPKSKYFYFQYRKEAMELIEDNMCKISLIKKK